MKTPDEVEYEVQFAVRIRIPIWMDQANRENKTDRKALEASIVSSGKHAIWDRTSRIVSVRRLKAVPKATKTYARVRFYEKLQAFRISTTKSLPGSSKRRWALVRPDLHFQTASGAVKWIRGAGYVLERS